MSTQNSEFTRKLRAAVKAKLEEYGLEVDEELPDYVMIMVGNKKDKVRMKADLKLFLGDNTSPFVDWLFDFFQKVKTVTSATGGDVAPSSSAAASTAASGTSAAATKTVSSSTDKEKNASDSKHRKRRRSPASAQSASQQSVSQQKDTSTGLAHEKTADSAPKKSAVEKASRKAIIPPSQPSPADKKPKRQDKDTKPPSTPKKREKVVAPVTTTTNSSDTKAETKKERRHAGKTPVVDTPKKEVVAVERSGKLDSHGSSKKSASSKKENVSKKEEIATKPAVRESKIVPKSESPPKEERPKSIRGEVANVRQQRVENDYANDDDDDALPERTVNSKVVLQSVVESPQRKIPSKVVVMRRLNDTKSQLNRGSSNIFKRAISDAASVSAGYGAAAVATTTTTMVSSRDGARAARKRQEIHIDYDNEEPLVASKKSRASDEKMPRLFITVNSSGPAAKSRIISQQQPREVAVRKSDEVAENAGMEREKEEDEEEDQLIVNSKKDVEEAATVSSKQQRARRLPPKSALLEAARESAAAAALAAKTNQAKLPSRKRSLGKKASASSSDGEDEEDVERENRPARSGSPATKTLRRRILQDDGDDHQNNDRHDDGSDGDGKKKRPQVLPPEGVVGSKKQQQAARRRNRLMLGELGDDELAGAVEKAIKRGFNAVASDEDDDDEEAIDFMLRQLKRRKRNRNLARTLLRLSDLSPKMVRVLKSSLADGDLDDEYDPAVGTNNIFDKLKREANGAMSEGASFKHSSSSGAPLWDGQINLELSSSDDEAEIDALLASANEEVRAASAQSILHPPELPPPTAALSRPGAFTTFAEKNAFAILGYNPAQYQALGVQFQSFTPPIGRPVAEGGGIFPGANTTAVTAGVLPQSQNAVVAAVSTTAAVATVTPITKTADRCRFWPDCRNEDVCPFHHPTKPCTAFPNCWFGDKCLFVHPPCKFGMHCLKPKCAYTHYKTPPPSSTIGSAAPALPQPAHSNLSQVYGGAGGGGTTSVAAATTAAVSATSTTSITTPVISTAAPVVSDTTDAAAAPTAATITASQSSATAAATATPGGPTIPLASDTKETTKSVAPLSTTTSSIACRYGGRCQNLRCTYKHPPLCRFGMNCLNVKCYFLHRKPTATVMPTLSKCYNTSAASGGNATATSKAVSVAQPIAAPAKAGDSLAATTTNATTAAAPDKDDQEATKPVVTESPEPLKMTESSLSTIDV